MASANGASSRDTPSVAVVITTYNHADFLGDAIQSVLAQTQPATEVVVVDDGSADDPAAVVARYHGVRSIRQPNQGLAAARNTGLRAIQSDKVIFLDADDRLLPNAVAASLACFASAPECGFVYGAYRMIDREGRRLYDSYRPIGQQPYTDMLRENVIGMHATVMYDRAKLTESGGFDPTVHRCEDYEVFLRMTRSQPVASHPEIIAEYRWHGNNMSLNHREMLRWALRVHSREAPRAFARSGTADDWRQGRRMWRSYYALEILGTAKANWSGGKSFGLVARGIVDAMTVSPLVTLRWIVRDALRRLARVLPAGVTYRLKRLCGKRPRPPLGAVRFGDLDSVTPISDEFGFDRGTPIDRYYIEAFLRQNSADIAGRVLEVGDDAYCRRFGGPRITHQDVLHVTADNPMATIVGDLSHPGTLPAGAFDCLVLTQTLHLIFDLRAAIIEMRRAMKPGGVVLLTVPGITQIDRGTWGDTWFWSLTPASAEALFAAVFGAANIRVETLGNVFAATAFLQGLAVEEIDTKKLQVADACYPVVVAVRAQKIGVA